MDRREALKKLGVGGAIAVGAPLVASSFQVAHAVSGEPPTEPPDAGDHWVQPQRWYLVPAYTFTPGTVTCGVGGDPAEISFTYATKSFIAGDYGATTLDLSHDSNSVIIEGAGWRLSDSMAPAFFTVTIVVTWTCGGTQLRKSYAITKTAFGTPGVLGLVSGESD